MSRLFRPLAIALALASCSLAAAADTASMQSDVLAISREWAHIKYQVADSDEQLKEIDQLARKAAEVAHKYPGQAVPLLWQGIVTSEEAALAHTFDQLGYAETARDLFQQAEAIDPRAAKGGVLLSLGVLYYRVPGFPIGFGNDAKARNYLERAAAIDPDGLDTAYFYGDFLIGQGEDAKARAILTHGLAAPVSADRPVWDQGRRREIESLIAGLDRDAAQ